MNLKSLFAGLLSFFRKKDVNNHGVPSNPVLLTGDTVLTPTITLPLGTSWLPYLSQPYDNQVSGGFDQLDCVSAAGTNTLEAILNYYYLNKLFPVQAMTNLIEKNYLNDKGFVELSVPYIAGLAGTTKNGLTMDAFWNAVNIFGMVPKKNWNKDSAQTWADYYTTPPQEVIQAGEDFAKIFQWNWKAIVVNDWSAPNLTLLKQALQGSPVHFASEFVLIGNDGIQHDNGTHKYQHSRVLYSIDTNLEILDQYYPFTEKADLTFPLATCISASLKII